MRVRVIAFRVVALAWLLAGLWALSAAGAVHAKAVVAQWLIARSWSTGLDTGQSVPPWPWADQRVAYRLDVPALEITRYVFDNDSGAALAFGPGYRRLLDGPRMISGHRDTHFAFLADAKPGMALQLVSARGEVRHYELARSVVVDSRRGLLPAGVQADHLLLVTCYPFDALRPGGALRLMMIARPAIDTTRDSTWDSTLDNTRGGLWL